MARRKISALTASEYVSPEPEDSAEVWQARLRTIKATKSLGLYRECDGAVKQGCGLK